MYKSISAGKFGLIIILFFLPFVTFSCTPEVLLEVTGLQLVTGDEIAMTDPLSGSETLENLAPEQFAQFALGLAVAGLIGSLIFSGSLARLVSLVCGGGGLFFLYRLKDKIESDILAEAAGVIQVEFQEAFWAALVLFGLAALVAIISLVVRGER
jgi:hypothetical protein